MLHVCHNASTASTCAELGQLLRSSGEPAGGASASPAHFIVLSSSGLGMENDTAQLRELHPGAMMSGGGAEAVFLDDWTGMDAANTGRGTVAIGFR